VIVNYFKKYLKPPYQIYVVSAVVWNMVFNLFQKATLANYLVDVIATLVMLYSADVIYRSIRDSVKYEKNRAKA